MCVCMFFFFKQKTADEVRISDWSSDVCSSDLRAEVQIQGRITEVWDKGKAAVLGFEGTASDGDGEMFTAAATLFVRGAGGFGGERGPSTTGKNEPDRKSTRLNSSH